MAGAATRVLLEVHEGRVAGALLENRLLDHLTAGGAEVLVVTPGARVPAFADRFARPGVWLTHLPVHDGLTRPESLLRQLDGRLRRGGRGFGARPGSRFGALRGALWRADEALARRRAGAERALLAAWRPDVVVAAHVRHHYGRRLVAAAHERGIATVGNLFSWDNAYRGLSTRPRRLTCWSERNRRELEELWGYAPERVTAIGAPFFDAYLAPGAAWSRDELCRRLGLDPGRPILLYASLGQFRMTIDETSPFEALLRALDAGAIPGRPQVVLRLHPTSRSAYFSRFTARPDVVLSRYEGYHPGLGWYPSREEMTLAGNLFRHADAAVSPGSTVTLEAAIFDTPTVVPVFNEYMPEEYERFFSSLWLEQHLRPLVEQRLLVVARDARAMVEAVGRALADPAAGAAARAAIRRQYLEPLDGRATERFAAVILAAAREGRA